MPSNNLYVSYETYQSFELYAYFFEKGISLLCQNGVISYITASLYLKGMKFDSLRKFIEKNTSPIYLKVVGDNVFENVKMPTAIFIAKKNNSSIWFFSDYEEGNSLFTKIDRNSIPLKDISLIMRGLEIGKDKVYTLGDVPFITGSNIQKYSIKSIKYISTQTLLEYGKNPHFFSGERILIRETGSTLTSIYLDTELNSNRSLYSIKLTDNRFNYKFVLACLNSKLLQFYYQIKFKSDTNLFPKIRIGQAKELPIPEKSKLQQQPIITLVNQILEAKQENPQADTSEWENEIDQLVYQLYGLTDEEIAVVELN